MITNLLLFYGCFLIGCGIASVVFIGPKAKTALISGGTSAAAAFVIAYLMNNYITGAQPAGLILSFALFCVFSWRSTKTLFTIFTLVPGASPELKGKGIAFLIISLMAVVSMVVFILQIVLF